MIGKAAQQRLVRFTMLLITKWGSRYIRDTPKAGGFKYFRLVSENWGIKFSFHPDNILENYKAQKQAFTAGVGPYCFGYTVIPKFDRNRSLAFYVTESVPVLYDILGDYWPSDEQNKKYHVHYFYKKISRFFMKIYGKQFNDAKPTNCGVKNGEIICIDFDSI